MGCRRSGDRLGQGVEPAERFGELFAPGPGGVDADEEPSWPAGPRSLTPHRRCPVLGVNLTCACIFAWGSAVSEVHGAQVAMRGWLRWDRALRRKGFDSTPVHGVKVVRVVGTDTGLAGYFTKVALELTSSWTKDSRAGRSPFAILRDATETYRADDIELWREFEQASWGHKQLTWSLKSMDLRIFAGLGREASDDEVAAEEVGGDDAVALVGDAWSRLSRDRRQAELLSVTDEGGVSAAVAWLDVYGLGWWWARPGRREPRRQCVSPDTRRQARAVLRL